jgi:hypothetical protein
MKSVGIGGAVGLASTLNVVARLDLLHKGYPADALEAIDLRGRWNPGLLWHCDSDDEVH